jgi:hypothetical protein
MTGEISRHLGFSELVDVGRGSAQNTMVITQLIRDQPAVLKLTYTSGNVVTLLNDIDHVLTVVSDD